MSPRKAYWIAHVRIIDMAGYLEYRDAAAPVIAAYDGRMLALGESFGMEGHLSPHAVIVEFPTLEAARDCYLSAEYQRTIALRAPCSQVALVIVEGAA